ncbi:MAG: hypothetical protein WD960_07815 [Gemmatimonadota bacterium]
MPVERLLRAGAVLLLALLFLTGLPRGERIPEGALRLPGVLQVEAHDPDLQWPALLRHAAEAPLAASVSGDPPPMRLTAPRRLRAGRPAALGIRANVPLELGLTAPTGVEERLELGSGEEGAFLLRPREAGWATWTLATPELGEIDWTGFVAEARALRILALSGPPAPESRMAIRALEEAGEEVEAWIHLGRDLWVGREGGPLPTDPDAWAAFDVVLLFPGLELATDAAEALHLAVRERGLGLVLAGTAGGNGVLARAALSAVGRDPSRAAELWDAPRPIRADSLEWTLPPVVSPLSGLELTTPLRPLLEGASTTPVSLGVLGRGRIAALSLTGTWQWRMEEGRDEEHRAFWKSLAEWLSDGLRDDPDLEPLGADVRAGNLLHVRWTSRGEEDADESRPLLRTLSDVGDAPEGVGRLPAPRPSPVGRTTFGTRAALEPGAVAFLPVDSLGEPLSPGIGIAVSSPGALALDPEGRVARLAARSPAWAARGGVRDELGDRWSDPTLLFGILLALFATGWILRRRTGRS